MTWSPRAPAGDAPRCNRLPCDPRPATPNYELLLCWCLRRFPAAVCGRLRRSRDHAPTVGVLPGRAVGVGRCALGLCACECETPDAYASNMAHPDGAAHTPKLEVGQHLCLECFGEELRAHEVTVVKNKKRSAARRVASSSDGAWRAGRYFCIQQQHYTQSYFCINLDNLPRVLTCCVPLGTPPAWSLYSDQRLQKAQRGNAKP